MIFRVVRLRLISVRRRQCGIRVFSEELRNVSKREISKLGLKFASLRLDD